MLAFAHEGVREGTAHGDDAVRSRHLQLDVGIVGDHLELGVAWPPQDGVVRPREVHHLEGKHLRAEVGSVTKLDGQVDLPE